MDSKFIYDYILKIQSIAKIGLIFSQDPYAITNYTEINELSLRFLEEFMEVQFDRPNYFKRDIYPTPSISVRTLIMNEDKTKISDLKCDIETYNYLMNYINNIISELES